MRPVRIAVLGSTGSIGRQAVEVASRFPDRVQVVSLAAGATTHAIAEQARALGVSRLALADEDASNALARLLPDAEVGAGPQAVVDLAEDPDCDLVLNALVGAAGLRATVAALGSGKRLALANKESLVVGGELVTELVSGDNLIPVDSEHSAIFQCMLGEKRAEVSRIWLTASGGPFRGRSSRELEAVTVEEALAHPTWTMGPKITIDSATLMNKGLEAIEAHHLFGVGYDSIRIVIHPQSCIHSMVEFADGSVKAHLGATNMRIPIQYAMSYPERWDAPVAPVDFAHVGSLDFEEPDLGAFRCLALALEAGKIGGTMPAVMNAANEVAVAEFLAARCAFTDIARIVEGTMSAHDASAVESLEHLEAIDAWARATATRLAKGAS